MRSKLVERLSLFILIFLVSCGPVTVPATETPYSLVTIQTGILDEQLINKDFVFDNCSSDTPFENSLTFGQVLSEGFSKELTLGLSGTLEVGIPATAKTAINANITDHFSTEKKIVLENTQATKFSVPERASQRVTVVLRETMRRGEVSYTDNGETYTTGYSYRINLETIAVKKESLVCPTLTDGTFTPSPMPIPTELPPPTATLLPCGNGFDITIWTPVTTNPYNAPGNNGVCWQLGGLGISMFDEDISFLETDWSSTASWYGVTRLIQPNSRIVLEVEIEKLINSQIWIGFTEYPGSVNSGRFLTIKPADWAKPGNRSAFSIVEMNGGQPSMIYDNVFVPFDNGRYKIYIELDENRMSIWLNNGSTKAFSTLEVTQCNFFIGYLSSPGVDIDVKIDDIQIQP
jgi:hypothetical protein